jgi:2-dehydropantoate 2-reductase
LPHETSQPAPQTRFSHVALVGPGAVGCVFAVRLALVKGGPRVTLIDHRPDRAARLSARPILIHTPQGDLQARIDVRTAPADSPDLVLFATKAYAAHTAAEASRGWIGGATVLTIQNGLGVAEEVAAALPEATVLTAVIYQAANMVAEGEVAHVANLQTYLGYAGCEPDDRAGAVAALLSAAGLPAEAVADIASIVWGKLLVNAAINPVAALAGVLNADVAARPTLRALAETIALEGEAVARAEGVRLPYASAPAAVMTTARKTADNRCSMLQDLDARRPTEIEYLNGALVRLAERHGVKVPANRAVATLIRQVSASLGGG